MNKVRLKDIAEIIMGQSPESNFVSDKKIGLPLLNGPAEFTIRFPIPVQYTSDSKRLAKENDILFCVRGSTTGRMNIADQDYSIGRGLAAIRHKNDSKLNIYIKAVIESNLKKLLGGTLGSVFPNVTKDNLFDLEFYCHEQVTQQKIAAVLWALDDKIELNSKVNAELEAMAKTLYDYWFVQFEFPVDFESAQSAKNRLVAERSRGYKSSGGKLVYNPILKREIPEGWDVKRFGDLVKSINTGLNPRDHFKLGNGENFYITIKNIEYGIIKFDNSCDKIDNDSMRRIQKRSNLEKGDILFTSIEPVGKTYLLHENPKNWNINESVFSLKPNLELLSSEYLFMLASSDEMKFKCKNSSTGSIHKGIRITPLKEFSFCYPPLYLIEKFTKKIGSILSRIDLNQKQNQELTQLRDWLLPMLMNGQVKVREVEISERIYDGSHDKLVAETFGEYLSKKLHNINDKNKELAALVYLMNSGLGINYGNVALQKAVFNSSFITPNLYSKKYDFINYNYGTFSKELADDLSHNPYLKTKKIGDKEVYEIEQSKKVEILNVLSSPENKDFVSSINRLINLYRLPFINKETNKMELLNTVLKIHSDLKTTDIEIIYQAMKDWKIKQTGFNSKAEKFSKEDTEKMIELLLRNNVLR